MIEIEKRILIDKEKYDEMLTFLTKNGKLKQTFKRFTMVSNTNPDFIPETKGKEDLRVRTTGETGKLTMKYGDWHADAAREEYEVGFKTDEIKELLNILRIQQYLYYIITYIQRFHYTYDGYEITLDKYYSSDIALMEVEISVNEQQKVQAAEKRIDEFLAKYDLTPLDSEGMIKFITGVNNVKSNQIDFAKISIDAWYDEWKDFIYCRK
jgi:CYTH domain-containing protein